MRQFKHKSTSIIKLGTFFFLTQIRNDLSAFAQIFNWPHSTYKADALFDNYESSTLATEQIRGAKKNTDPKLGVEKSSDTNPPIAKSEKAETKPSDLAASTNSKQIEKGRQMYNRPVHFYTRTLLQKCVS